MSFTLADITPRVRQRLNDSDAELFTDIVLLPYAQDACDELQLELELFGALILEEISTPPITIPIYTNLFILKMRNTSIRAIITFVIYCF